MPVKLLAAIILALTPLYEALVYPLILNECNRNGRGVSYSNNVNLERNLVIDGKYYSLKSSQPVLEMFSTGRIDSVHFGRNTSYGESNNIVSAAQIYDGDEFDLRVSGPEDVACGPFYRYVSERQNGYPIEEIKCLAFSGSIRPESYIGVSQSFEIRRTWRTAFKAIEWKYTKFDFVTPSQTKQIHELKEFSHKGLSFPILLNLSSIGSYSCKAEKAPDVVVAELLTERNLLDKKAGLSKEFSISRLKELTNKFWKFELPEKVYLFQIGVYDNNNLSSARTPLSVTLNAPKRDYPIIFEIKNNSFVDWVIQSDKEQTVFVEQFAPKQGDTVQGLPKNQVWKFDNNEIKENYLLMFYYKEIRQLKLDAVKQHRFCEVVWVPRSVRTTPEFDSCDK